MIKSFLRNYSRNKFVDVFECAVTVGAVAAVASVGVAAYGQYSQSKAQGESADQAQKAMDANAKGMYGSKVDLPDYEDSLGEGQYNQFDQFEASLPAINNITREMNRTQNAERQRLSGKTFLPNIRQQGTNINSMLKGEIPDDVADVIQRTIAERVGGTVDPGNPTGYAGGMGQPQSALARSLGLTSMDIMDKGMSYAPEWEKLVDSFIYKPGQAVADSSAFLSAAQLQLRRDENKYEANASQAIADSQADPSVAGALNDRLKLNTIKSQADANQAKAMAGLITAGAGGATDLYNAFKPAPAAVPKVVGGGYNYNSATGFSPS